MKKGNYGLDAPVCIICFLCVGIVLGVGAIFIKGTLPQIIVSFLAFISIFNVSISKNTLCNPLI